MYICKVQGPTRKIRAVYVNPTKVLNTLTAFLLRFNPPKTAESAAIQKGRSFTANNDAVFIIQRL